MTSKESTAAHKKEDDARTPSEDSGGEYQKMPPQILAIFVIPMVLLLVYGIFFLH